MNKNTQETTNKNFELKLNVLGTYLETDTDNISASQADDYLVCTDEEADEAAKENILDSLWAFNASFIMSHMKYKANGREYSDLKKAIEKMQGELCESANCLIKSMIDDLDHFVSDAISADGRGHFLTTYDNEENEIDFDGVTYFIYRLN